jgi:hypothetical protein
LDPSIIIFSPLHFFQHCLQFTFGSLPNQPPQQKESTMIRFHKLALGAAFVAAVGMSPSSIVGNVGKQQLHFFRK